VRNILKELDDFDQAVHTASKVVPFFVAHYVETSKSANHRVTGECFPQRQQQQRPADGLPHLRDMFIGKPNGPMDIDGYW